MYQVERFISKIDHIWSMLIVINQNKYSLVRNNFSGIKYINLAFYNKLVSKSKREINSIEIKATF